MNLKDKINNLFTRQRILAKVDIAGKCDLCETEMPPNGDIITSAALKELVKTGFNPEPKMQPLDILRDQVKKQNAPQNSLRAIFQSGLIDDLNHNKEKLGISQQALAERMKKSILEGKSGDWSLCPNCFKNSTKPQ